MPLERSDILTMIAVMEALLSKLRTAVSEQRSCHVCGQPLECGADECFECWRARNEKG